ncbi:MULTISPECIES: tetratricopeptide repeat protein [unclassified Saccharicrinis]|uniref:tetratricopeptide repeat protein n=1 Tax=unclassified Saccharicrinis TaxID=2646859 RepID=UPI003D326EC5
MKNILSVTLLLFTMLGAAYAQEEKSAAEFKNEGNAALKAKDYKTALASFEAAIEAWDESEDMDAAMVYNTATCARKLKNNEKALKYYAQSKELGYKEDVATFYSGMAYKSMDKMDDMEKVLLAGVEEFPNSKYIGYMKKELGKHYVKQANEFFTNGISILNTRTDANRDQWDAIKGKAKAEFDQADSLADKALGFDAKNKAAKTIKIKIVELLKS